MKKYFKLFLITILVITLCGCNNNQKEELDPASLAFKEEYEKLNGQTNANGKVHRTINISESNPFEKITTSELINKIEVNENLYVYFGDPLCPWCRSVLEKAIEVAKNKNIKKIYYVKIWDDNGTEVLRSKYTLNKKNKPEVVINGTEDYYKLINYFKDLLKDYTLTTTDGKTVNVGEKRIYAPNFIYIENKVGQRLVTGISDLQKDSREELTKEMLTDEETIFNEFFK